MSIRDLGFLAWKDDLAWLEKQRGKRWELHVAAENRRFTAALKPHTKEIKEGVVAWKAASQARNNSPPWIWKGWMANGDGFSPTQFWTWGETGLELKAWDFDVDENTGLVAIAAPESDGFERFHLEVWTTQGKEPKQVYVGKERIGPYVGWLQGKLLWIGSSADLRYDSLHIWDPRSEKSTRLLELKNQVENISLIRLEDGEVAILGDNFQTHRLGFLNEKGRVDWVAEAGHIIPINRDIWLANGKPNRPIDLPEGVLIDVSLKAGWAITNDHGIKTLWDIGGTSQAPKSIVSVWGEISTDSRDPYRIDIQDMRYEPYCIMTTEWSLSNPEPYPYPCSYHRHPSPMFVVHPEEWKGAKGLLVTAYGAYGDPTRIGSLIPRWEKLLNEGWAIASVMVPGSGDHDESWRRRGQRQGRQVAIDALRTAIKDLQEELGVSGEATALYGRSAGGLLVISTAVQNPGLVGALYVESPYVDVLRTISNPTLPLTLLETYEFGIGTSPTDILATSAWSPLEHIPAEGIPDLFVVARADLNDLQVYPYEVIKFILRIRGEGKGQPKLLRLHTGRGHFATTPETRVEDQILLNTWLTKKNHTRKYKMANRKNVTRRNRKNRNNAVSRKNRRNNATMAGGKRRKGRKSSRKGSRKH